MFDAETIARLRAVLDEVCADISCLETGARTHVASKILEAATRGETSADRLKQVGRQALGEASRAALPLRRRLQDAAGPQDHVIGKRPRRPPSSHI
jgi:hypothetical protein